MSKICLITPGHLVTNPRLVKEATAITKAGMQVHLIFSQYLSALMPHDKKLLADHPEWTYDRIDWTTGSLPGIWNRSCSKVNQYFSKQLEYRFNRHYGWQLKKAMAARADLYIGHNLGALPVAVQAARLTNAKCGFDAEDFHRNQSCDDPDDIAVQAIVSLENRYLPQLDQLTAGSPEIAKAYAKLTDRPVVSILNVFPQIDKFEGKENKSHKLRLFWFSQLIGPNRGLEMIIEALGLSNVAAELHLLGFVTPDFRQNITTEFGKLNKGTLELHFHDTVYPDDLFTLTAGFDIGLAAEPGFSMNNKMALSNKLFTYIQCGLALAVSDTFGQRLFMEKYPQIGRVYKDAFGLAAIIIEFDQNRDLLFKTKKAAFEAGRARLNWENESQVFLSLMRSTL